ncbi:MAG: glycosyltransferase family 4 protein [Desulfobulbus sp.]|jgi:glycosyltransferase involved in cell wall biosynthesis|nr:glycosyltransferase family 4 protein [Desulfobulbus sp.]
MKMKQVWMFNHYAQEPGGAGGTRHFSLAKHLRANGWAATIIAASVELNTGRQRLADKETTRYSMFDLVPFLWVRTPAYTGSGIGRLLNMLTYSLRVVLPSTTKSLEKPDVIVGSSVHPFAAWSGALLAKRFGVPFVFEVRDLWPQTLVDMGKLTPNGAVTRLFRALEKWLYRQADRIVVLLPKASDYIVPLGIPAERIVWIPNGVELSGYPVPDEPDARSVFTLMYFGAHGQANGLDCVLRAMAALLPDPDMRHVRLRMVGDGPLKPGLQQLARKLRLDNVVFDAPVPKRDIPPLAAQADAFVFNLIDAPVFKFGVSSNKLFDFLAAARPVIFCCNASNNPVEEASAGLTVPPGDPAAIASAIRTMVHLAPELRAEMGLAGRRYVEEHHSFSSLAVKFASTLEAVVAEHETRW